jgi:hypothetical protein
VRYRDPRIAYGAIRHQVMRVCRGLLWLCFGVVPVVAQPSGGPYGPIRQTYALPATGGKVHYAAPDGQADQSGESLGSPTTLAAAIERARGGDAVILRGGVYRTGNLRVNQGITIQPYADEQPVLKGTLPATRWRRLGNGLWVTHWDHLFPAQPADWWQRDREGKRTPLFRFNNDMVFVDGRFLQAVGWEGDVDSTTYCIDYEKGNVYIGVDPAGRTVEITAHDVALLRTTGECHGRRSDGKGYTIRGIAFMQYAYRALEIEGAEPEGLSDESHHGNDVVGTTLEDCTIAYCSRVGGYFRGDRFTMRRCRVSDTSTEGVYVIASDDVVLEKNVFTRNNIENITGYYPAAVKIFNQCHRATCRDNLVIDHPHSNGIWYDVGNVDGVFVNNWIEGIGSTAAPMPGNQLWPSDNGFFFEISRGAVCAGNVFVDCDHGVMVLNSSRVRIYQNTFVNSAACIGRNSRSAAGDHFGWHPSTGPDVDKREGHVFANNVLVGDGRSTRPLLFVWQPDSLCMRLPQQQLSTCDHNAFIAMAPAPAHPLILWSPVPGEQCQAVWSSPEELHRQFPHFGGRSPWFPDYSGPLFKGLELGNYQFTKGFPAANVGMPLPAEIDSLLGPAFRSGGCIGAYPLMDRD